MPDLLRRFAVPGLVLAAFALIACGSDAAAPGQTPPSGPALAGTGASRTTAATPPQAPGSGTAVAGTPPAGIPDGTYAFDLSNAGFTAELLLAVRQNALVVSQLNISNNTGSSVNAVPRIRYLDAQQRSFDAITEPDWRALYPESGLGLANGQRAQIRVGFTQPFNPQFVTFCLTLGVEDLGCFARRVRTPVAAATP